MLASSKAVHDKADRGGCERSGCCGGETYRGRREPALAPALRTGQPRSGEVHPDEAQPAPSLRVERWEVKRWNRKSSHNLHRDARWKLTLWAETYSKAAVAS